MNKKCSENTEQQYQNIISMPVNEISLTYLDIFSNYLFLSKHNVVP